MITEVRYLYAEPHVVRCEHTLIHDLVISDLSLQHLRWILHEEVTDHSGFCLLAFYNSSIELLLQVLLQRKS